VAQAARPERYRRAVMADDDQVVIEHPNRRKASSQLARLLVIVFLIASAAVVLIISVGGWETLEGAKPVQIAFVVIYFVFALFVARWTRGVLPMIAALAIILAIFGGIAAPAWFDRDKAGFTDPALSADILGLLCALLVSLQIALMLTAMIGFRQRWNVEIERASGEREPEPAPA
jgi:energy-coupling factor transporter transmembrane protein EcfT